MDWELQLIGLYETISQLYKYKLCYYCERRSNYSDLTLSDEEVLTLYIFGILKKRTTVKEIYEYSVDHLAHYFPNLSRYGAFTQRLNNLSDVFIVLAEDFTDLCPAINSITKSYLIDSMPIMIAQGKRACVGRAANELADLGYCASKKTYFHGVKLHVIGQRNIGHLPRPFIMGITPGSYHDLSAVKCDVLQTLDKSDVFADKAYFEEWLQGVLAKENEINMQIPYKEKKDELMGSGKRMYSKAVNSIRQPIEAFFSWIQEKTRIQVASKVRSYNGLMVHTFGKLAAAMWLFNNKTV